MKMTNSVIIVGAGPAGMFAAYELSKEDIEVLILEKGKDVEDRTEFEIMSGIGGAGTYSDGTVNLRPDIGGDLKDYTHDEDKAWGLVEYIRKILKRHGMPEPKRENPEKEEELKR
ncbi:MAG: FAD-dependent oxidoreductase, partial [Candidatus Saliniplasma sp.]